MCGSGLIPPHTPQSILPCSHHLTLLPLVYFLWDEETSHRINVYTCACMHSYLTNYLVLGQKRGAARAPGQEVKTKAFAPIRGSNASGPGEIPAMHSHQPSVRVTNVTHGALQVLPWTLDCCCCTRVPQGGDVTNLFPVEDGGHLAGS